LNNLVCVFAHPDDEFTAAGLLLRAKKLGYRTHLICGTRGEAGKIKGQNFDGDESESLKEIRLKEIKRSCELLSIDTLNFLDLSDNNAVNWNIEEAVNKLKTILLMIGSAVVVTFNKDGGNNHPDHKTIHNITVSACGEIEKSDYRLHFVTKLPREYIMTSVLGQLPNQIIEKVTIEDEEVSKIIHLTDDEISIKKEIAINYKSQFPDENGLFYKLPFPTLEKLSHVECYKEFNDNFLGRKVKLVNML